MKSSWSNIDKNAAGAGASTEVLWMTRHSEATGCKEVAALKIVHIAKVNLTSAKINGRAFLGT